MDRVELYAKRLEISDIGIDNKTASRLVKTGYTLEDLKDMSYDDIIAIRGIGEKGARSVVQAVRAYYEKTEDPADLLLESEKPKEITSSCTGADAE